MGDLLQIAGLVLIVVGLYRMITGTRRSLRGAAGGDFSGVAAFLLGVLIASVGLFLGD